MELHSSCSLHRYNLYYCTSETEGWMTQATAVLCFSKMVLGPEFSGNVTKTRAEGMYRCQPVNQVGEGDEGDDWVKLPRCSVTGSVPNYQDVATLRIASPFTVACFFPSTRMCKPLMWLWFGASQPAHGLILLHTFCSVNLIRKEITILICSLKWSKDVWLQGSKPGHAPERGNTKRS